jgi:hypothetical protein
VFGSVKVFLVPRLGESLFSCGSSVPYLFFFSWFVSGVSLGYHCVGFRLCVGFRQSHIISICVDSFRFACSFVLGFRQSHIISICVDSFRFACSFVAFVGSLFINRVPVVSGLLVPCWTLVYLYGHSF